MVYEAFQEGADSGASAQLRALRLIRLLRLLRLTRLKRILQKYGDTVDLTGAFRVFMSLFGIMFLAHIMSCVWYYIGCIHQPYVSITADGTQVHRSIIGWVHQDPLWCFMDADGDGDHDEGSCMG